MPNQMSKSRKYRITPNSIDPSEEAAVRSVMDKFRQRAEQPEAPAPPHEVIGFPSQLGAQVPSFETSEHDSHGRPTPANTDAQDKDNGTPNNKNSGRPAIDMLDAQSATSKTPNYLHLGRPISEEPDAQNDVPVTPNSLAIGRPTTETSGAKTPNAEDWAPSHSGTDGAKTPNSRKLGAQVSDKWAKWDKNRVTDRLALRPNAELLKEFKIFCVGRNYTLTEFFELAGRKFIELDAQLSPELGALAPLDDGRLKMLYKSRPFIINLYLTYTAAFNEVSKGSTGKWTGKWLPRDDEIGLRYNEISPVLVELGILQTMMNKGIGNGRINTFQYYTGEINAWIESGIGDVAAQGILKYHRVKMVQVLGREVDLSFLDNEPVN